MKFKKEKEKRLRDVHQLVLSKTGEKKGLSAAKLYFAHFLVGPESSTSLGLKQLSVTHVAVHACPPPNQALGTPLQQPQSP